MKRPFEAAVLSMASGASLLVLAGLTGCSSSQPEMPATMPGDPAAEMDVQDRPRDVRPPPVSSGIGSNPNNPNGLPGPSSGLGTSSNRY